MLASAPFNSFVNGVLLDGNGGLYFTGNTQRLAFLTTPGAYQPLYPGGFDSGYAAKFDLTTAAPAAQLLAVTNAASFYEFPQAPVAPGEIVSLFGQNFPANPKLTFDGRAAPILYADSKQINAVVPFEVTAPSTAINLEGVRGYVMPVWPAFPGLFSANGSGSGQVAAINQDGTVNSSASAAPAGSVIAVYMTGAGAMMPPIADGATGPLQPPFPMPVLGVSAQVNGVNAPVQFIGQAPGSIAGVVQVNIQIPPGTPSGNASLVVSIGNYQTQLFGCTIAVQ